MTLEFRLFSIFPAVFHLILYQAPVELHHSLYIWVPFFHLLYLLYSATTPLSLCHTAQVIQRLIQLCTPNQFRTSVVLNLKIYFCFSKVGQPYKGNRLQVQHPFVRRPRGNLPSEGSDMTYHRPAFIQHWRCRAPADLQHSCCFLSFVFQLKVYILRYRLQLICSLDF